jgi:putative transposase
MGDVPISAIAHSVMSRFARWQNRRLGRSGHLFERRHRSILVREPVQLVELLRYIHRNPLRAGLAVDVSGYRWTSHRTYLGLPSDVIVVTECCLGTLAPELEEARERYRRLMERNDNEQPAGADSGTLLAGRMAAAEAEVRRAGRRVAFDGAPNPEVLVGAMAELADCTIAELTGASRCRKLTEARAAAALVAREHPRLHMSSLAKVLGRDLSTLSRAADRFARRAATNHQSSQLLGNLRTALFQNTRRRA